MGIIFTCSSQKKYTMVPKAAQYGFIILGSVLTLHLGSTFIKPFVTVSTPSNSNRSIPSEEEFINKLKQL